MEPDESDELQFDEAEFEEETPSQVTCEACSKAIEDEYFTQNGQVLCRACSDRAAIEQKSSNGCLRVLMAGGLGLIGGAVGFAIYCGILLLTGYEIGLIAIVVGWLVGLGVNMGSGGRGGVFYQLLAVVLTYFAIVMTYVPLMVKAYDEKMAAEQTQPGNVEGEQESDGNAAAAVPRWAVYLQGMLLAPTIPFTSGFENIIGLLIIGFALYQAWVMNRVADLEVRGPFRLSSGPPLVEAKDD